MRLADFGLAHAFAHAIDGDEKTLSQITGTPQYMAPEQFLGDWRSFGPWTDLYALGCVAWHCVTGEPPFRGQSAYELGVQHVGGELPNFVPRFEVPEGLTEWLYRALAVKVDSRFQRAADALAQLPFGDDDESALLESEGSLLETETSDWTGHTLEDYHDTTTNLALELGSARIGSAKSNAVSIDELPLLVPASWRRSDSQASPRLVGAGLGLFGLREPPFVGREDARDELWDVLKATRKNRQLHVVMVVGEAGVGKSRLIEWICTRAHELGAAEIYRSRHAKDEGASLGLRGLVIEAFQAWKLSRQELYTQLVRKLSRFEDAYVDIDARALTEFIQSGEGGGSAYQFTSEDQKFALLNRVLIRLLAHRTPILWLDDLDTSLEAMRFVNYLLELPPSEVAPVLILGTVRSATLTESEELSRTANELVSHRKCQCLRLEAVNTVEHQSLIQEMLPLSSRLAKTLAQHTEGNPLFAFQLINHLIQDGELVDSDEGFELKNVSTIGLPEDIHQLWMERLDRLFECWSDPRDAERALELAAVLGREVDLGEWEKLCEQEHLVIPQELESSLVQRGLAQRRQGGWSFAHGLLVASVEKRARSRGYWKDHHRSAALMLERLYPSKLNARRRAGHWIAAGVLQLALKPLVEACNCAIELGNISEWESHLALYQTILAKLDVTYGPGWIEERLLRTKLHIFKGEDDEATETMRGVLDGVDVEQSPVLFIRAMVLNANLQLAGRDFEKAQVTLQTALDVAEGTDNDYWRGMILQRMANAHYQMGLLSAAEEHYRRSSSYFEMAGSAFERLLSESWSGWIALYQKRYSVAEEILERVLSESSAHGFRRIESHCFTGLGEIARFTGASERARYCYGQAHLQEKEMGHAFGLLTSEMNLGQVEIMASNFEHAQKHLEEALKKASNLNHEKFEGLFDLMGIAIACGRKEWEDAASLAEKFENGWPDSTPVHPDHVWLVEMASWYAAGSGGVLQQRLKRILDDLRTRLDG